MRLTQLPSVTDGKLIGVDCDFSTISTDSRVNVSNGLFVALRGEHFDGHNYLASAEKSGAVAVVVEHQVDNCTLPQLIVKDTIVALGQIAKLIRQSFTGPLVAITGSCGKTSVKGFLNHIFSLVGNTLATQGNFNNHIGVPLTLNRINRSHQYAIVEMGTSGKNEIAYIAGLAEPTIAMVNNIRPAHLGGFGSMDAIADEKGAIYQVLLNSPNSCAVINLDEAFASQYLKQTQTIKQIGFSVNPRNLSSVKIECVYATNISTTDYGSSRFELNFENQSIAVELKVLGRHFVNNALAASACALAAGIKLPQIAIGLAQYTGEKGRMQLVDAYTPNQKAKIINDAYNANPGSMRAAIEFLAAQKAKYRVLVMGYMGELGEGAAIEHTSIGIFASEMGITHLIAVGPLPQLAAESFGDGASDFDSIEQAAVAISTFLTKDAVILIKGSRGAEMDTVLSFLPDNIKGLSPC